MLKKSKGQRRSNQRGVQKRKIKARSPGEGSIFNLLNILPRAELEKFYKLAEECFFLYARNCCRFYLVPLILTADRRLAPAPRKHLIINYAMLCTLVLSMLHKLGVFLYRITYEDMNILTFVSAWCFLCYLVPLSVSFSVQFQAQDTIQLVNGWENALECFPDRRGRILPLIANTKTAIVVLALGVLAFFAGVTAASFSLLFRSLPVCLLPTAEAIGLVPMTDGMARLGLKLLFWPLELVSYMLPMMLACWAPQVLMTGSMVIKNCTERIRQETLESFEDRMHVWSLYIRLQVCTAMFNSWVKNMVVFFIFSASSAIILNLYLTLRHNNLPIGLYLMFPYTALSLMGVLFWLFYEWILMIRSSEDIVDKLISTKEDYYVHLHKPLKQYISKRGRATRALDFNIADFMDASLDVPLGIWDEILNQLLFLLSF